jgi:NTE family protein
MLEFVKRSVRGGDREATSDPVEPKPEPKRLSIGLALGGGSARGFAHIGVIKTLVANGIKPDVIAGTSIGAVAGGLYAAGKLDEFEAWARSLTRRRIFGYMDFSFAGSGLIGGTRLAENLMTETAAGRIEDLPMRFAAIATEIGTGHEIWLTRGRLADALCASYALPGIFAPLNIGGRWLMDGALVNPVPVSAARAMGARLVISVNLNADMFGKGVVIQDHGGDDTEAAPLPVPAPVGLRDKAERALRRQFLGTPGRPGFSTVMVEAFSIMQDRITRARLAGDPPDVSLSPRLAQIGFFDFHRAADTIQLGVEAAEKNLDAILESVKALS